MRILPQSPARHKWCLDGLLEEGSKGCASAAWDEWDEESRTREKGDPPPRRA